MLTTRFDDAFRYAHQLHREQTRKGTPIAYISHLMTVSALVIEHGGNEDHPGAIPGGAAIRKRQCCGAPQRPLARL